MTEKLDINGQEWRANNYRASDFDAYGKVKKRIGLPDQAASQELYRQGWDRIFGKKESEDK